MAWTSTRRAASGATSIGAEHRASAICERLIAPGLHQPPGRPRGIAVTATPPAERHGLPALMAAACLREELQPFLHVLERVLELES